MVGAAFAIGLLVCALSARAERSDRLKKPIIDSDNGGQIDLAKQTIVFSGNVVITQGTMVMRAGRVEVRELPSGYRIATAYGSSAQPATFRQKRDGVDETIEGAAERLEYDGKSDTVRFVQNAEVRRLRGATLADQATGNLITYNATTERIEVSGGARPTAANPTGRVRVVLTPREGTEAAAEAAAAAASAPASGPATGTLPTPILKPSPALGAGREAPR